MHPIRRLARTRSVRALALAVPATAATILLLTAGTAYANVAVTMVSSDPFTDAQAQHRTEVEPDTYSFGNTIVAAFQIGRVFGGGASDTGFATSNDRGVTWVHGSLPGITRNVGGIYDRASDAAVAFDARHNVWLISSLALRSGSTDVLTSRSTDGGRTWSRPITTATGSLDKNWIVCDNTSTSPFFGHCYTEYRRRAAHEDVDGRRGDLGPGAGDRRRRARAGRPAGGPAQRHGARPVPVAQRPDPLVPLDRRR